MDDGRPYTEYLFSQNGWTWNRGKYRTDVRTLNEVVDGLVKEAHGIDNVQRVKSQAYALVKGQLAVASRKKTLAFHTSSFCTLTHSSHGDRGNLSVRSMAEVVSEQDFAGTINSEYLETVLVAVPKYAPSPSSLFSPLTLYDHRNLAKEWESTYERLTSLVVPRSSSFVAHHPSSLVLTRNYAQETRE